MYAAYIAEICHGWAVDPIWSRTQKRQHNNPEQTQQKADRADPKPLLLSPGGAAHRELRAIENNPDGNPCDRPHLIH